MQIVQNKQDDIDEFIPKEFAQALINLNVYDLYKQNVGKRHVNEFNHYKTFPALLSASFVYSNTIQGFDFWYDIEFKLHQYED